MHNMVYLIGRIVEIRDNNVRIAVQRSYKNEDGIYETDFMTIFFADVMSDHIHEYCHKGDLIGIKGFLRQDTIDDKKVLKIIADKISFLGSKSSKDEE